MTTKYKNVPMELDIVNWGKDAINEIDVLIGAGNTQEEIAVLLLDVSRGYISFLRACANGDVSPEKTVSLTRYLLICNELGLDPRKYFVFKQQ